MVVVRSCMKNLVKILFGNQQLNTIVAVLAIQFVAVKTYGQRQELSLADESLKTKLD